MHSDDLETRAIVIVEFDQGIGLPYTHLLQNAGFSKMRTVSSGDEFLSVIAMDGSNIFAVVLSPRILGITPCDIVRHLMKQSTYPFGIIMIIENLTDEVRQVLVEANMIYLQLAYSPVDRVKLLKSLQKALDFAEAKRLGQDFAKEVEIVEDIQIMIGDRQIEENGRSL